MTFSHIFSKSYLFDPTPPSESRLYLYLIVFFGVLILLTVFNIFSKGLDKEIRKKQLYCYPTIGILGFIYLFARHEELLWLGSRLTLVIILLGFFIWVVYITVFSIRHIPKKNKNEKAQNRYEKYLPKRK